MDQERWPNIPFAVNRCRAIFLVAVAIIAFSPRAAQAAVVEFEKDAETWKSAATGVGDTLAEVGKSEGAVPEGLTGSDWKSIRQAYEQHRHAAVAVDGGFRARNPGQQWLTRFDGRGFAAALSLGAQGIWMGTRFIASKEARAAENYKQRLVDGKAASPVFASRNFVTDAR